MLLELSVTLGIMAVIVAVSNFAGTDTTTVAAGLGLFLSIYAILKFFVLRARVNIISFSLKLDEIAAQDKYLNFLRGKGESND